MPSTDSAKDGCHHQGAKQREGRTRQEAELLCYAVTWKMLLKMIRQQTHVVSRVLPETTFPSIGRRN